MLHVILAVGVGALIFVASEILWRKKIIEGERARKFLHITSGLWTAYWPWLISFKWIIAISMCAVIVVLASRRYTLFHALHDIDRTSVGDIVVALGVSFTALLLMSWQDKEVAKTVFALAVLHLSIADGLAALVGKEWGKKNQYRLLGKKNSLAGSLAFFSVSIALQSLLGGHSFYIILLGALVFTLAEASSLYGLDNVSIPVVVTLFYAFVQMY